MITVTKNLQLDENELSFQFVQAGGPGGQHVNKVATAVQLRFNIRHSTCLSRYVREQLQRISRKKINADGFLVIEAKRYRSQHRNREDAVARLVTLIRQAIKKPRIRIRTQPPTQSRKRRLTEKKKRGDIKKDRQRIFTE